MLKFPVGGKKIGLALSGGVSRSLAHIGVLKVFKKEKIPIDFIAGTSGGAMVGALFAFGLDPFYIDEVMSKKEFFNILKISFNEINPFAENVIEKFIEREIGKRTFANAYIPLAVVAQDLKSGNTVVLNSGRVGPAVAASCAFPGVFKPKRIGGYCLIDGGGADNLPVSFLAKMGANYKIAVDVVPDKPLKRDISNPIQVIGRAIDLAIKKISASSRVLADVLIEPEIPPEIWHTEFYKAAEIIKIGETAAEEKIEEIKQKCGLS